MCSGERRRRKKKNNKRVPPHPHMRVKKQKTHTVAAPAKKEATASIPCLPVSRERWALKTERSCAAKSEADGFVYSPTCRYVLVNGEFMPVDVLLVKFRKGQSWKSSTRGTKDVYEASDPKTGRKYYFDRKGTASWDPPAP